MNNARIVAIVHPPNVSIARNVWINAVRDAWFALIVSFRFLSVTTVARVLDVIQTVQNVDNAPISEMVDVGNVTCVWDVEIIV